MLLLPDTVQDQLFWRALGVSSQWPDVSSRRAKGIIMGGWESMEPVLFAPELLFWHLFCSTAARYGVAISEQPRPPTRPCHRY